MISRLKLSSSCTHLLAFYYKLRWNNGETKENRFGSVGVFWLLRKVLNGSAKDRAMIRWRVSLVFLFSNKKRQKPIQQDVHKKPVIDFRTDRLMSVRWWLKVGEKPIQFAIITRIACHCSDNDDVFLKWRMLERYGTNEMQPSRETRFWRHRYILVKDRDNLKPSFVK